MMRRRGLLGFALVSVLLGSSGCPIHVACGDSGPTVTCQRAGSVQIAANDLDLPATAALASAVNCLAPEGTCSVRPRFEFRAGDRTAGYLTFSVELAPTAAPGMFPLSSDPMAAARAEGLVRDADAYRSELRVRSGFVNVERNDREALQASFDVEIETPDGLHVISLTGRIDVTGCNNNTYSISTSC